MKIYFNNEQFDMSYCISVVSYNSTVVHRNNVKNYPYRISFSTKDMNIEHNTREELSNLKKDEYKIQSRINYTSLDYIVTVFFKTKNDLLRYKLKSGNV